MNSELFSLKAEAQFDSWVTVGADNGNDDKSLTLIGFPKGGSSLQPPVSSC